MMRRNFFSLLSRRYSHALKPNPWFAAADLKIERTQTPQAKPKASSLVFGREFSDHMFTCEWTTEDGWREPKIEPVRNFSLHPGAKVLHYAQEIFEGMKAYVHPDGKVRLFRPEMNIARFQNSARRVCFPSFDEEETLSCIKKLVSLDQAWVPNEENCSLYIRPTMIGIEPTLGVAPSGDVIMYVLTGPVGPYYPTGFKPVSLMADPSYVRAWPGGTGDSKLGSNYAPTMYVQKQAMAHGCQQVVWLFGEDEQLTEVGTMNIFVVRETLSGKKQLITPCIGSGLILPGITRQSIIDIADSKWLDVEMVLHSVTMKEIHQWLADGSLKEMFGAGTACVVSPIDGIVYYEEKLHIPTMDDEANSLWMRALNDLNDIQYGRIKHPWQVDID